MFAFMPYLPTAQTGADESATEAVASRLRTARSLIESSSRELQQTQPGENEAQELAKTLERRKKIAQQLEQEEAALNEVE